MKKIVNARLFNNKNAEILIDNKKIIKIADKLSENVETIDAKGGYVLSGLVNCYFDGDLKSVNKLLQQGVTSVFDFSFDDKVTEKLISLGLKVFKVIGDKNGETLLSKEFLKSEVERCKSLGVIEPILYTINPNLSEESNYTELINFARENDLLLATKSSETLEDVGEIDKIHSFSPISLLESYGFLDRKCMLIDCVYVDKEDVGILKNYDVSICTCPTNNLKNGNGIAPVYSFVKNNVNVVVGGESSNHFKEISLVKDLQSGTLNERDLISDDDIVNMSSNNPHKIFKQIGLLGVNEFADLVIVDDNDFENLNPINVKMVIIDGEVKYRV